MGEILKVDPMVVAMRFSMSLYLYMALRAVLRP